MKMKKQDFNLLKYQHHGLSTAEWIKRCFEIQTTPDGEPIVIQCGSMINEDGKEIPLYKYKIKRYAELWLISLVVMMDLEFAVRKNNAFHKKQSTDFAFYGSYSRIRNVILNSVDSRLVPQLSRSITFNTINTSLKRAAASGLINIQYDETVTRNTCTHDKNYRRITLNYDKLQELCDFEVTPKGRSKTWWKYHHSSREHKFMRKRPVSYCKKLIDDLADKNHKDEFKAKLAKLKLKYKNYHDILKAFIITNQKRYLAGNEYAIKFLTTIKSEEEVQNATLRYMYQKPDESGLALSEEQQQLLKDFYSLLG